MEKATYFRARRPLNILIAEDNLLNQRVVMALLDAIGHKAVAVENGELAVAAHANGDYDLILMDVRMPKKSGIEATRDIRAMPGGKGRIPIVALTADAVSEHGKACLDAGMNAIVTKPIDRARLAETMNEVMRDIVGENVNEQVTKLRPAARNRPLLSEKSAEQTKAEEAAVADFVARIAELSGKG